MKIWRRVACAVLLLVVGVSLCATFVAPAGYARQYREAADAPLLASTGWEPTTSAAIALHGCYMEPDFPSCLLRQPLCFQL